MEGLNFIAAAIAIFGSAIGPLSVTDKLFQNNRVNDSTTKMSGQLRTTMFIGVALIEAVPILGVVVFIFYSDKQ